ncbi:MAG: TonB-dependent hemoglobin/transferrin/lactoferrin family receptor, partial [Moraxella sp.]|nr:TonB-dependent hemoglobin/transferrin/lactoferrin family receptor [Moraxella sp.]
NELFSPYGYIYEGRFNPDLEMMRSVRIQAGADSLIAGSGAVGGSVSYMTKNPKDLLKGDNQLGGYVKVGYTNKNEEHMVAAGLAGRVGKFEALVNYTKRIGHELKNHDMKKHNKERLYSLTWAGEHKADELGGSSNSSSLYPDSSRYESDAVLGKIYYQMNDQHRFGIHGMYQTKDTLSQLTSKNIYDGARFGEDSEDMKMYGVSWRYTPESKWLEELGFNYTNQNILGLAYTHNDWLVNYDFLPAPYMNYLDADYRPTEMDTQQFRLTGRFMPLDLGKFGEHTFNLATNYNKIDYKSNKIFYDRNSGTGAIENMTQKDTIPFPDAKKDNFNLTLSDKIYFNDRFNALLGIRYDSHKYAPYFQNDVYGGYPRTSEVAYIDYCMSNPRCGKHYLTGEPIPFYKNYANGVYNQKTKFDKLTYGGQFEWAVLPDRLTTRYKVGTGFLAPTVTQMYSSFIGQKVQQVINTDLKPETSLNQELEFEFNFDPVTLTLSAYRSDYKNFIHSKWWNARDFRSINADCFGGSLSDYCIQSVNLDDAKVEGYKVGVRADLSKYLLDGNHLYLTADYHTSKDEANYKADRDIDGTLKINTMASVPATLMLGMDYHLPDDKATLHIKARHIKGKKADETKSVKIIKDPDDDSKYREVVDTYQFINHSKDALVLDVYGSYKINDNLKLNAGVYNLTNEKYIPWDSLRQFAITNINSHVDEKGLGMNRYTAPGRNYAISLTYEF